MLLLTYVPPKFTQFQFDELAKISSPFYFNALSNAFRMNEIQFSDENYRKPKPRQLQLRAIY